MGRLKWSRDDREAPRVGEKFRFKGNVQEGDPFPPMKYEQLIEVLAVKDGWVMYSIGPLCPDERRPIEKFLDFYVKHNGGENG